MTKKVRGHCLIMNNKTFDDGAEPREGSDLDVRYLTVLFEQLYFEVIKPLSQYI